MKQKKWKIEDVKTLKNLYPETRNEDLCVQMGITKKSLEAKAYSLGLKKTREFIGKMVAKRNKMVGRNLTNEKIQEIALNYKTRGEFQKKDPAAYTSALRKKILNEVCKHMTVVSFSIPQLILKNILDKLLKEICIYNDRKTIKPYEIDLYYEKFNLGFEYQGKGWHKNNKTDLKKKEIFKDRNINIVYIFENNRRYEEDIKQQIILNLEKINLICGSKITNKEIETCAVDNVYIGLYNKEDLIKLAGKYESFKEFKRLEKYAYYKLRKMKILDHATSHMTDKRIKRTADSIMCVIKKCDTLKELIKNHYSTYLHIKRFGLNKLIEHLKDGRKN